MERRGVWGVARRSVRRGVMGGVALVGEGAGAVLKAYPSFGDRSTSVEL